MTTQHDLDAWISVRWDGRRPTASGTLVAERRTPGQGHRAGWAWDGATLTLMTDRYGMVPLYYWAHDGGIAAAFTLSRLLDLGAPRQLDWEALGVFLQLGWYQGETTAFAAIRVAPPVSASRWSDGRLQLSGGPTIVPPGPDVSRQEAVATYSRLFAEAIEETAPAGQQIVLPLSGGRDSRHILLALSEAGARPRACLTYGRSRRSPEWQAASRLAARVGAEHRFIQLPTHTLAAERRKNEATDFASDEHVHYLALVDGVAALRAALPGPCVLYDGLAGDILSAGWLSSPAKLAKARRGEWAALARDMIKQDGRVVVHPSVASQLPPLPRTIERIAAEFERHAGATNPVASYLFWNRTRREVALAPLRMISRVIPVQTPFLHPPLFDWLAQLPGDLVQGKSFHDETMRAAYPGVTDVPFAEAFPPETERIPPWGNLARLAAEVVSPARAGHPPLHLHHAALLPRFLAGRLNSRYRCSRVLRLAYYVRDLGEVAGRDLAATPAAPRPEPVLATA